MSSEQIFLSKEIRRHEKEKPSPAIPEAAAVGADHLHCSGSGLHSYAGPHTSGKEHAQPCADQHSFRPLTLQALVVHGYASPRDTPAPPQGFEGAWARFLPEMLESYKERQGLATKLRQLRFSSWSAARLGLNLHCRAVLAEQLRMCRRASCSRTRHRLLRALRAFTEPLTHLLQASLLNYRPSRLVSGSELMPARCVHVRQEWITTCQIPSCHFLY